METTPPIRVLLVDDHAMVVEGFRQLLDNEPDIEVVAVAGTVVEAVRAAAEHRPDVVLMDLLLPDGDGVAAASRIISEVGGVKIVMLTGSDIDQHLPAVLEAGCVGFVEKTRAFDTLAPAVRSAAAGELVVPADAMSRMLARPRRAGGPAELSEREHEVLVLMAAGMSNQAIADRLVLSVHTVRTHVQTMLTKLDAHSKLEAVAVARRRGLLD